MTTETNIHQTKDITQEEGQDLAPKFLDTNAGSIPESLEEARDRGLMAQGLDPEDPDREMVPGLYERMEDARIRVTESREKPSDHSNWDNRRARELDLPKPATAKERVNRGMRVAALLGTVLSVGYVGNGIVGNSVDRNIKFQDKNMQPYERHAKQRALLKQTEEQVQAHESTTHSP